MIVRIIAWAADIVAEQARAIERREGFSLRFCVVVVVVGPS